MNDGELRQFVQQIETLNGEIASLNTDKSEIFKAAKQQGFDVKILRRVIAERAKREDERVLGDEMFRRYWRAVTAREPAEAEA